MAVYNIPVNNQNQISQVQLLNVQYTFRLMWNQFGNCWYLDISDINDNYLVNSVPLLSGRDILKQFKYLNIGGALIVYNSLNPLLPPGFSDFGVTSFLWFIPYG